MNKIPFVDGTKTQEAYVTINEQNYNVTPAVWSGNTPLSAFNLNKMQDNIEEAIESQKVNIKDYVSTASFAETGDNYNTRYRYEVGNNSLEVYHCGIKLQKGIDYEEVGTTGETSNWIKMLNSIGDLDMSNIEGFEDFEETIEFVVRGDYS